MFWPVAFRKAKTESSLILPLLGSTITIKHPASLILSLISTVYLFHITDRLDPAFDYCKSFALFLVDKFSTGT